MENKLQELTNKLYEEGLSKGRADADRILSEAQEKARKMVAAAKDEAEGIKNNARKEADELRRNTMTEISLAGKQAVAALKESISGMIIAKTVSGSVRKVTVDPQFVRDMLLAVGVNWNGASSGKVTLSALLPADWQEKFGKEFETAAKELLKEGIEVGYSEKVKTGFKVGEKGGGYYISFSDADFDALLGEFLKEKVAALLYGQDK